MPVHLCLADAPVWQLVLALAAVPNGLIFLAMWFDLRSRIGELEDSVHTRWMAVAAATAVTLPLAYILGGSHLVRIYIGIWILAFFAQAYVLISLAENQRTAHFTRRWGLLIIGAVLLAPGIGALLSIAPHC